MSHFVIQFYNFLLGKKHKQKFKINLYLPNLYATSRKTFLLIPISRYKLKKINELIIYLNLNPILGKYSLINKYTLKSLEKMLCERIKNSTKGKQRNYNELLRGFQRNWEFLMKVEL